MAYPRLILAAAGMAALLLAAPAQAGTFDLYVWPYCPAGSDCGYASEEEYQLKVKDMIQELNLQWEITGMSFRPQIQPINTTNQQFIAITACSSDKFWCDDLMTRCDPDSNGCGGPCLQRKVCADMTTECANDTDCSGNGSCIEINRQRAGQWRIQDVEPIPNAIHMLSSYGRWKCCSGIPPNDGAGVVPGMLCHSWWGASARGMGGLWAHETAHHFCLRHTFTKQDLATHPPTPNHEGDGLADTLPDPLALETEDRDPRCLNSVFLQTCNEDADCQGADGPCDKDFIGEDYEFCTLDPLHADVSDDSPHSTWCTTQCKRCDSSPCHLNGSTGTFLSLSDNPNEEVANSYWGGLCRGPFIRNGIPTYAFSPDERTHINNCRATYPELGIGLQEVCANQGGDSDHDGICNDVDNCDFDKNTAQRNSDGDNQGDACDPCPQIPFLVLLGPDWDTQGNLCDKDKDNDGCNNDVDQHPNDARIPHGSITTIGCSIETETIYVHESHDSDGDGVPNCLDLDDDNDNICDEGGPLSENSSTGVPPGGCQPGPGQPPADACPTDSTNNCHVFQPGGPCLPLWDICNLSTTCLEFYLKILDLINPVPDVTIEQFEIINGTIYALPSLGLTASELANNVLGGGNFGGAVAEGIGITKRIEIWRRSPDEFVAVVADDYDSSQVEYMNDINYGRVVAFIPPDDAGTPMAVGTTYASGVDLTLPLPDRDRDGRPDWADNCVAVANFRQVDSDGDGYGNACDADLNDDGRVTDEDVASVRACDSADLSIGTPIMEPEEMVDGANVDEPTEAEEMLATNCPDADLNGDRRVDDADAALADAMLGGEPGPSAYVNRAPVAVAGFDDATACNVSLAVDGCGSFDPDGDLLSHSWTSGSCTFDDPAACDTEALCDQGDSVATLIVNDGTIDSAPDPITIAVGACASPGAIPPTMLVRKDPASGGLVLEWESSCLTARNYGVFEGQIGSWYSHAAITCTDTDGLLNSEPIVPAAGDSYYVVVPLDEAEGSYGEIAPGVQRPRALNVGDRCLPAQTLTACP